MRKVGKIIRHFRRQGNNIPITIRYPIRKADRTIFFQISDPKSAPNEVVGFFNDYDKLVTYGWQVFWVGAACLIYRSTSDEFKEVQKKHYAHQQELITAIAGLNKDYSGKVDEVKEVVAQEEGVKNETAAAAAEKNETASAATAAAAAAEKNETAAAVATAQEDASK